MARISDRWTIYEAAHLLNRAGFGGSPSEVRALHQRGRRGAVDWLLSAEERQPMPLPEWAGKAKGRRAASLERKAQLEGLVGEERQLKERELQRVQLKERRRQELSLFAWWVEKMRTTEAPLREKMTLFWHDHFPSHIRKVRQPQLMLDQNELFRSEALGNFGRLTQKVAQNPAMMLYLDSALSNKKKPNENFARELLELFTLGEGHYNEQDVKEAARAFTGYKLNRATGEVSFVTRQWDEGEKSIFGHTGAFEGSDVVGLALARSECAEYLAAKLWDFFAYERPSPELIARLGKQFAAENYELSPLLREIFLSPEFYSAASMRSQIKSPLSFVLMMNRQLEMGKLPDGILLGVLTQLGQVPFRPPNVAGWDWGKAWVNTNTLLARYHFAGLMTGASGELGKILGALGQGQQRKGRKLLRGMPSLTVASLVTPEQRKDPVTLVDVLCFRLFQATPSSKDRKAFENYAKVKVEKDDLLNDEDIAELMHLMMSTPAYQLT